MTKAMRPGLVGSLLALLALPLPFQAAEKTPNPKTYAVLVGIGKFSDPAIKSRPHAVDDARALYDLFTSKEHHGMPRDQVKLLLSGPIDKERSSEVASRGNILQAVRWLAQQAGRDDRVLFAFIGQGAALGQRGDRIAYFATDSDVKDTARTGVLATALTDELDKLKSRHVCMFVDVYFKGYTRSNGGAPIEPNAGPALFREFFGTDNSEEENPAPGRVLFLATAGRKLSPDGDKHGIFTQVVLDGLKGKADKEGYEPDGLITSDELADYLNKELPPLLKKLVPDEKDRPRQAIIAGEDAHVPLTFNPEVQARAKERLEKFANLVKENKKLTEEIAQEGKTLLSRMPKLKAQRNLRKEYQALVDGKQSVEQFLDKRTGILDSSKLSKSMAHDFAEKVIDATKVIKEDYVKDVNQGQMIDWAIRGLYREVEEKVPADVAKKLADTKALSEKDLLALLMDVRLRLGKREDLDNHKDIDQAILRMLAHLDPYTTFYTPDKLRRTEGEISGQFIGVGIQIRKDPDTDQIYVITPILGSPAYNAGIQAGDLITSVTRFTDEKGKTLDPPEVLPTKGLDVSDAVKKIVGKPGSKVKLTVKRPGVEKPLDFELTRRRVQTESVMGVKRKDASWDYFIDPRNKIAYVRLTQFQRNSTHQLVETMAELKKQGIKGLILDLRDNPGGLLDGARDITDLFIGDGTIVEIRPRDAKETRVMRGQVDSTYAYEGRRRPLPSYTEFPMVCLINGFSASASEIVSAALQDHGRALIIGERSYGKGSVQNVLDFEMEGVEVKSKIKLTIATYWRPSKKNINKASTKGRPEDEWGVIPDRVIPLEPAERSELFEHQRNLEIIHPKNKVGLSDKKDTFKDRQLDAAVEYLRGQIKIAQAEPKKKAG